MILCARRGAVLRPAPLLHVVPFLLLALASATVVPANLHAAPASAASGAAAPHGAPGAFALRDTVIPLETVIVAGTRVPQTLLRTPAAVSIVPEGAIQRTNLLGIDQALNTLPGVLVQSRAGAQDVRITIRGFGARGNGERSNAGNTRGIRILTDGIPVTEPDGRTTLDLVDMGNAGRIEVSRSNVSALYGNASGGVVNLRSPLAFDRGYGEFAGRFGAFGLNREQLAAGFTTGTAGRGYASLVRSRFEGWREHSESSTDRFAARYKSALDPATNLAVLVDLVHNINRYPGPLTAAQADSAPQQANPTYVARDERRDHKIARLAAIADHTVAGAHKFTATGWVEPKILVRSERNRFRNFDRTHVGGSLVYDGRVRYSSGISGRVGAGIDDAYQDGAILFYTLSADGGRGDQLRADKREGANAFGAFAETGFDFGTHWSAGLGIRYDKLKYKVEDHIDPSLDATKDFEHGTPKASLAWHGGDHTIYAALGGGVEAPAFNEIDPPAPYDTATAINPFLEPMLSTNYEIGGRGAFGPGDVRRWSYDAALYWIETRNEIVPYDGGAYYFSAGKTRRKGAELMLAGDVAKPMGLRLTGTWSQNEFVEYAPSGVSLAGNEIPGLPELVLSGTVTGRLPGGVVLDVTAEHLDSYWADDANTASVDASTLLHAGLSWSWRFEGGGTFSTFLNLRNLTDEKYTSSVFINGVSGQYYEPGLPRNAVVGVNFRFE
jgi:iron complex outermembrane receptor protein